MFVLDSVFSDADADYPAGSYVRNPIGSAHAPLSEPGCTMLVKLHQFDPADTQRVMIDTHRAAWHQGMVPGLKVIRLDQYGTENAALEKWAAGTRFNRHRHWGGEEIFVIDGTFQDEHGDYPAGSWLRNPHLCEHMPFSTDGCTIYVKTGHLAREPE